MRPPKKLHFIWIGAEMPQWMQLNIERWKRLNPGWPVSIHDESVLADEYRELYSRMEDLCSRSDLLRLSVLRRSGGWYFDVDFVPIRPMDDLLHDYCDELECGCFLTKQWDVGPKRIANGVIGMHPNAVAWEHIDTYIDHARLMPLERTTFGPLLATRIVERCPETCIADVNQFYPWRFSGRDESGMNDAIRKYLVLLDGDFDGAAIEAVFGDNIPYAAHLWCGGKYDWSCSNTSKPTLKAKSEARSKRCPACAGRDCGECGNSGFSLSFRLPPRSELETWAEYYGWRVQNFDKNKIVLLPT